MYPSHAVKTYQTTFTATAGSGRTDDSIMPLMTKDTQPVNLVGSEWHEIEALENGTVFVNVFAEEQK